MTTLNNSQQGSYTAAQQLTGFLRKSKSIYTAITRFRNKVEAFFGNVGSISGEASVQALLTTQPAKARNTLEGTISDGSTGQPVESVTIIAGGKNKTAVTNAAGFYHLSGLKAGTHTISIAANGYEPQTIQVKVIRGKTVSLSIALKASSFHLPKAEVA